MLYITAYHTYHPSYWSPLNMCALSRQNGASGSYKLRRMNVESIRAFSLEMHLYFKGSDLSTSPDSSKPVCQ
jgi:hypothetical protein